MFKRKGRKTSTQSPDVYRPSGTPVGLVPMGTLGEEATTAHHDVMPESADTQARANEGAVNEPLVHDFASMHDGSNKHEGNPPLTPPADGSEIERPSGWLSDDEATAPPPPDFTRRGIHIPSRTSSNTPSANKKRLSMQRRLSPDASSLNHPATPESQPKLRSASHTPVSAARMVQQVPKTKRANSSGPSGLRSSSASMASYESSAPDYATQPIGPLQQRSNVEDGDRLSPLMEDDPRSFDLIPGPLENEHALFSLELQSEQLFSKEHLEAIFKDTPSLLRFTSFLSAARPKLVPVLIYYLDALKASRAIAYANAVAEALEPIAGLEFTDHPARPTMNAVLEEKSRQAFDILVRDALPAFVTHIFIQVVSVSISKRVVGNLPPMLRDASEGLAEVFCLTDPSRTDNPIIFASEEFHRTTQYGVSYAIGRNCRFLQGPKTNKSSVDRFREATKAGLEHSEVFLNYRRDGSPFMNLLMMAPLLDSRGNLRYFIGAQIDVSGLVKEGTDLDAFRRMIDEQNGYGEPPEEKDEFHVLSEMFNSSELETVRKHGGHMHKEHFEENDDAASVVHRPRVLIRDQSAYNEPVFEHNPSPRPDGKLSGPYKHYLLIRPAPSLRILFTSPSLRVPGIMQSHFLDRIGGSQRVRDSLADALADGTRGVTAKIRWLSHAIASLEDAHDEGRPRWIHCTPLLGQSGTVGVWMVILIDDKESNQPTRRFRQAPPVASDIGRAHQRQADAARSINGIYRSTGFDEEDTDHSGYSPRVSLNGHTGVPKHVAIEGLRQPGSPVPAQRGQRNGATPRDQRALRTHGTAVQEYVSGTAGRESGANSIRSFAI